MYRGRTILLLVALTVALTAVCAGLIISYRVHFHNNGRILRRDAIKQLEPMLHRRIVRTKEAVETLHVITTQTGYDSTEIDAFDKLLCEQSVAAGQGIYVGTYMGKMAYAHIKGGGGGEGCCKQTCHISKSESGGATP